MEAKIVVGKPPNYERIVAAFGPLPETVIFAWGDTIFVQDKIFADSFPPELVAHEGVHSRQQAASGGPEAWWERYLTDARFRLDQEIEAYRAQIAFQPNRAARRNCLREVAGDLAGPMYGRIVNKQQALELLAA